MSAPAVFPTRYWHRLNHERVQCDLCPRACQLQEGQSGLCFVRACHGGEIVLTSYGRSSGFCVDPIEKKPLNHFYPGSKILSFGTAGCNLACKFCQNWHISKAHAQDKRGVYASPELIATTALKHGCRSVAYTYNDPVIFHEYALDTAQACHANGIFSVAVTAGYVCALPRQEFFAQMNAANVDLKSFSESFYRRLTGGHLQPVLDTLCYLAHETQVWLEITTLLIAGENDSDAELHALTQWIASALRPDIPVHFSAFHPAWKMKNTPATPASTLIRARDIGRQNGLHYVYTGNIRDPQSSSTYCHQCGHLLIGRDGYHVYAWELDNQGQCPQCHSPCRGLF
jgi:pyruvate formate lyase activating enzyme